MLQPQLEVSSDVCELRLPADLESFSLDSLADCFRSMGEQLHMLSASGAPLPPCAMLVMQTAAAAAAAASEGKVEAAATPTDTEAAVKDDAEVAAAESQAAEAATAATVALEVPPLPLELLAAIRTPSANLQQVVLRQPARAMVVMGGGKWRAGGRRRLGERIVGNNSEGRRGRTDKSVVFARAPCR
eukprot:6204838-Pleurochrysis_carterae.AAC.1